MWQNIISVENNFLQIILLCYCCADVYISDYKKAVPFFGTAFNFSHSINYLITVALSIKKFKLVRCALVCSSGETAPANNPFIFFKVLSAAALETLS